MYYDEFEESARIDESNAYWDALEEEYRNSQEDTDE